MNSLGLSISLSLSSSCRRHISTPLDTTATDPEMTTTPACSPHGRRKGKCFIVVNRQVPPGTVIRQEVEVNSGTTPARTRHDEMPAMTIFSDDVNDSGGGHIGGFDGAL